MSRTDGATTRSNVIANMLFRGVSTHFCNRVHGFFACVQNANHNRRIVNGAHYFVEYAFLTETMHGADKWLRRNSLLNFSFHDQIVSFSHARAMTFV